MAVLFVSNANFIMLVNGLLKAYIISQPIYNFSSKGEICAKNIESELKRSKMFLPSATIHGMQDRELRNQYTENRACKTHPYCPAHTI